MQLPWPKTASILILTQSHIQMNLEKHLMVQMGGPKDGWSMKCTSASWIRRQQGRNCIIIWAAIITNKVIGWFKVDNSVKLNSKKFFQLLNKTFSIWYICQIRVFQKGSILVKIIPFLIPSIILQCSLPNWDYLGNSWCYGMPIYFKWKWTCCLRTIAL